jgi:parallel beta-helix repeat protein
VDRHEPWKESIVNATGTGNAGFVVNANWVVIDGFTVTGGTAQGSATPPVSYPGGIFVGSAATGYYWAQILNNIIEKNGPGVYLYNAPSSPPPAPSPSALIEHNLFRDNNYGTGTWNGFGIVTTNTPPPPVITENAFTENKMSAMVFVRGSVTVTNNTSESDGAFVSFLGTNQCLFSHNQGKNFGRKGVLPLVMGPNTIYADAAVDIGPGNASLVISDNVLEGGEAPISNGMAFTTAFAGTPLGNTPNFNVDVKNNSVKGFPVNGIVADTQTGGTLTYSWIAGNEVLDNGSDGISIQDSNYNISLFDNQVEGNLLDCHDATTGGSGTLTTQDVWLNDTGNSSYPAGPPPLCTPGAWH